MNLFQGLQPVSELPIDAKCFRTVPLTLAFIGPNLLPVIQALSHKNRHLNLSLGRSKTFRFVNLELHIYFFVSEYFLHISTQ
jgi:hypothetical protein